MVLARQTRCARLMRKPRRAAAIAKPEPPRHAFPADRRAPTIFRPPLRVKGQGFRRCPDRAGLGAALQRRGGRRGCATARRWGLEAAADGGAQPGACGADRAGSITAIHREVHWRLCDRSQWPWEAFTTLRALPAARVSVCIQTLSRELRAMGSRKLSARPNLGRGRHRGVHKTSPPRWHASRASRASAQTR